MKNKIDIKLQELAAQNKTALVSYVVAGDPDIDSSYEIIKKLIASGSDIIEIGMPFSDPVADGKDIQAAAQRALSNNINLQQIFKLAKKIEQNYPDIPIILMGYLNPIFKYGTKKFLADAKENNISALIIVDLPYEEIRNYPEFIADENIPLINLITPLTKNDRLNAIDKISRGFIYFISVFGITGSKKPDLDVVLTNLQHVKKQISHKIAVGFGIDSGAQLQKLKSHADLVVIGSAYCRIIADNLDDQDKLLTKLGEFNQDISSNK